MTNILDQIEHRRAGSDSWQFVPTNTDEFFALRLASRLGDSPAVRHYVELAEQYSQSHLLCAYHRALVHHRNLSRAFHEALASQNGKGSNNGGEQGLAAIRIERRAIGVAVFARDQLKYADARQLTTSSDKAMATAIGFVTNFCKKFRFTSAVLESAPDRDGAQRSAIHEAVLHALRGLGIGLAEVGKTDLLTGFGSPPLRSRGELRKVIAGIYPVLDEAFGMPWTHDAAALGLYFQTERLFYN